MRRLPGVSCSFFLLLGSAAYAQNDTSYISGTVRDPSQAVVPNAAITVHSVATNAEQNTKSNSDGEYILAAVHSGRYNITAQAQGFIQTVIESVVLDVDQRLRVDISLVMQATQ
jgi:hypothetical protein